LEGKVLQRLMSPEAFCKSLTADQNVLRNNVGGHYNHSLFWTLMKPNGGGQPEGALMNAIIETFGTFDKFKESFSGTAKQLFGSGWTWLLVTPDMKLFIGNTLNQDNPLMQFNSFNGQPVLALDVWEHAYYLKYQNKRADYIQNWWNVVNWEAASALFNTAMK
jgi:Fe-Mn family superoxide dismutase